MRKGWMRLEAPCPPWASHNVEVIHLYPMRGRARMMPPWNQNDIMIRRSQGFIKAQVIRKNPLNAKAIGRIQPVIICLFEIGQCGIVIFVMAVGRVR